MADLSEALNADFGIDDEQFKEIIAQNDLFPDAYKSDPLFASDFDDEDEDDIDDDFDEDSEDLFDEDELEEEGYEEDFDFDEEEDEEDDEDFGKYN